MKIGSLILAFLLNCSISNAGFVESTITVDFPNESPEQVGWIGIDFESGSVVRNPNFGDAGWQMRLLQGYVSTNRGYATKIEGVSFDSVTQAPADRLFSGDSNYDPMGPAPDDTYNRPLMDWYEYHMFKGHLLEPKPFIFVIKTTSGHYVKVQFVDYIKDGMAIRSFTETDWLGRRVTTKRDVRVGPADGLVHVIVRAKYNDVAGDRSL